MVFWFCNWTCSATRWFHEDDVALCICRNTCSFCPFSFLFDCLRLHIDFLWSSLCMLNFFLLLIRILCWQMCNLSYFLDKLSEIREKTCSWKCYTHFFHPGVVVSSLFILVTMIEERALLKYRATIETANIWFSAVSHRNTWLIMTFFVSQPDLVKLSYFVFSQLNF